MDGVVGRGGDSSRPPFFFFFFFFFLKKRPKPTVVCLSVGRGVRLLIFATANISLLCRVCHCPSMQYDIHPHPSGPFAAGECGLPLKGGSDPDAHLPPNCTVVGKEQRQGC
jgi:hypothetical protein